MSIGILALQGAFKAHADAFSKIGVETCYVKKAADLKGISGVVLPGGESTAMSKQLHDTGLDRVLMRELSNGLPVMGTCAGLILLSKTLSNSTLKTLGTMNIVSKRNAYGRQLASFEAKAVVPVLGREPFPLVFIRAPHIEALEASVTPLLHYDGRTVAAQEKAALALAFHPELTDDLRFHEYFVKELVARCNYIIKT